MIWGSFLTKSSMSGGKVSVSERLLDPARGGVNRDMAGAGGHVNVRHYWQEVSFLTKLGLCIAFNLLG